MIELCQPQRDNGRLLLLHVEPLADAAVAPKNGRDSQSSTYGDHPKSHPATDKLVSLCNNA